MLLRPETCVAQRCSSAWHSAYPELPYVVDAAVTEVAVPTAAAVLGAEVPAFLAGGGVAG